MRNASKKVVDTAKIHILYSIAFFSESRAVYEIMWQNMVEPGRQQMKYGACALSAL